MCLHVVTKRFDPPNIKQIIGYKIFSLENDKLKNAYTSVPNTEFNFDVWQEDSFDYLLGWLQNNYRTGFHVFTSQEDAKNILKALNIVKRNNGKYCIKQVECTDIVAIGTQSYEIIKPHLEVGDFRAEVITIQTEVVVARKIKI